MASILPGKRILILCEGETEYLYTKALQATLPREKQRGIAVETLIHKPNDPKSLTDEAKRRVKLAKKEKNPFSEVWLFFDNDNWPQLAQAFDLIRREEFRYAYCSKCFEHWFILHFENCGRPFANGDEAIAHLTRLWPQYHKTRLKHFELLKDRLPRAKERAKAFRRNALENQPLYQRNPFITIDTLVEFFEGL